MYVIYPANEAINLTYEQFVLNEPNPKSDRVLTEEDIIQKYYPLATICCDLCDQSNRKTRSFDIMASLNTEIQSFHNLVHPAFNEGLKSHNTVTFKLLKTVADFSEQLSQVYEQHGEQLQLLVTNFRRRNNELYKERPSCSTGLFHLWELFLQEVENDSTASNEVALNLSRQVSRELLEGSFYRKIQSRKIFGHRESLETIITKTEDKLVKCRQEYKDSFMDYLANPDAESLTLYINTHNAYVQQLHATNGMLEEFNKSTIPKLLKELEDVYVDLCSMTCDAVYQCSDLISKRSNDQCKRYDTLSNQCRLINPHNDLLSFTKMTNSKVVPYNKLAIKRNFIPLQIPNMEDCKQLFISINERKIPIILKNELIIDKSSAVQLKPSYETLQNEANELENQIKQIQDSVENLLRVQQKSLESNLYNKVNELQENISVKSFDLYVAQIHLCAINSQKELFLSKLEINCETQQSMAFKDRKISISSNNTMKSKWMKALKSLKTTSPNKEADRRSHMYDAVATLMRKTAGNMSRDLKIDSDEHSFQEYTYKKITPCDICSQILRGHTRQGVRCKYCKFNVHMDCQSKVTSKCLPKLKLLKRQKSTSEIDYNIQDDTIPEDEYNITMKDLDTTIKSSKYESNIDLSGQIEKQMPSTFEKDKQISPHQKESNFNLNIQNTLWHKTDNADWKNSHISRNGNLKRRLFAGMKNLAGYGSKTHQNHYSVSLPEREIRASSSATTLYQENHLTDAITSPRRPKLNLRMKSFSLDSPESTDHALRRKYGTSIVNTTQSQVSTSRLSSPLNSGLLHKKYQFSKGGRISSVELFDNENEKSPSSSSISPSLSPIGNKKMQKQLTNLYVVLYNFKARNSDELDLKAGCKITVLDSTDPDWWKGKCYGKVGYFPSKYCTKISADEKPLQVTNNLQVSDGDNDLMLLRDQIVIQIGEEIDGMVIIRSADNRKGLCPVKYLKEI